MKKGTETYRQFLLENMERGLFIKSEGTITEEFKGAKNTVTI